MARTEPTTVTASLLAHRQAFKGFLTARLGNEADAEDLLQNALLKAVQRSGEIKDEQKVVPWFYQVLRNAVLDHVRSRDAAARRNAAWASDVATLADDPEAERAICACFQRMLPALKPAQAELLRRVDLEGRSLAQAASELAITPNHASVTLHRARAALKDRLTKFCGDCACLADCSCD